MSAAYWDKALSGRISRRRAIGTTLGVSAAAAFLAACGGASSKTVIESSKLFTNTAEEGSPKRGGVFQRYGTEPTNLDSYSQATVVVPREISSYIYSRLVRFKSAPGLDANLYTPDPDLAESWEVANDGLTYTFKLRKNVKFQDTAPVNGRLFDAQDVIASYNRFKSVAPNYASSFSGIVDSVSAPDSQTVTFKLSKRIANFINLIAQGQSLLIYPKEAGEGFDPKRVAVGTGPWQLDKLNPSQSSELKRNPNYYEKDLPYMDGVKSSFLSDAGTVYAQFLTGNFHTYAPTDLKPEEFAEAFEKIPNIRILPDAEPNSPGSIAFGRAGTPPYFLDDRIRKAVSLAIDRDTLIPTLRNADQFEKMGLPLAYHNQNFVPYVFRQWWVDPRDKEMGDAAQWFAFDQAKAKQLISAAGFPNGFDTEWRFDNRNGATPLAHYTVLAEEMTKVGIRAKLTIDDYNTVFQPKTQVGLNSGMLYTVWIPASDPSSYLSLLFGPGSNRNKLDVNDPTFNDLFEKQNQEIDTQKRRALLIETFKYLGNKMWEVPFSTRTGSYILAHPFVRNIGAYRDPVGDGGVGNQGVVHYWLSN